MGDNSSEDSNSEMLEESEDELNSKCVSGSTQIQKNLWLNCLIFSYHLLSR